jgi:imidazolonepropionase-like amidohydrolase
VFGVNRTTRKTTISFVSGKDSSLLFAGWLIDGTGGPVRKDVLMRVERGLIVSLEEASPEAVNRDGVVDLSGHTLLPGLVDAHVHLFMSGTDDPEVRKGQLDSPFEGMKGVIAGHLDKHAARGVVAVRDGGDYGGHALRYKMECLSPRGASVSVKVAGKAWRAPGRYGRLIGRPPVTGCTLAQSVSRPQEGADHLKIVNSGLNSLTRFGRETPPQFGLAELKEVVREGRRLGLKVMVHANGRLPVKLAVDAGCDSVEHGFFMGRENLLRMADHGTVWVPTACTMKAYAERLGSGTVESETASRTLEDQLEQVAFAKAVGVQVAVGTDSGSLGVHHGPAVREEIGLLIRAGFSPAQAVQSATSVGAALLGLEDHSGRLVRGMPATFLVIKGDPSVLVEAMELPERIYKGGERVTAEH